MNNLDEFRIEQPSLVQALDKYREMEKVLEEEYDSLRDTIIQSAYEWQGAASKALISEMEYFLNEGDYNTAYENVKTMRMCMEDALEQVNALLARSEEFPKQLQSSTYIEPMRPAMGDNTVRNGGVVYLDYGKARLIPDLCDQVYEAAEYLGNVLKQYMESCSGVMDGIPTYINRVDEAVNKVKRIENYKISFQKYVQEIKALENDVAVCLRKMRSRILDDTVQKIALHINSNIETKEEAKKLSLKLISDYIMETYFSTYKKTVEADIPIKMRYIKVYELLHPMSAKILNEFLKPIAQSSINIINIKTIMYSIENREKCYDISKMKYTSLKIDNCVLRNKPTQEESPFVEVYYLNEENGAALQGHAAMILIREDGTGVYYSFVNADGSAANWLGVVVVGNDSTGCLETASLSSSDVQAFLGTGDATETCPSIGCIVSETDEDDSEGTTYNRVICISITDEQGDKMFEYAEDLCEQDLTYNLYTHNCGMVVQEIFAQADIDFAPQTGASYKERWKHVLFSKPEPHVIMQNDLREDALPILELYQDAYDDYTIPNATYEHAEDVAAVNEWEIIELTEETK